MTIVRSSGTTGTSCAASKRPDIPSGASPSPRRRGGRGNRCAEDLRLRTENTFQNLLRFIGLDQAAPEPVREAVAFASFEQMQHLEATGRFDSPVLKPQDPEEPESFKVRRGKVGGYLDYLSDADIAYLEQMELEWGC